MGACVRAVRNKGFRGRGSSKRQQPEKAAWLACGRCGTKDTAAVGCNKRLLPDGRGARACKLVAVVDCCRSTTVPSASIDCCI